MYEISFPESKIKFNRGKTLKKCEELIGATLELCGIVPLAGTKSPIYVRVHFVDVAKGVASMKGRIKVVGRVGSANPRAILAKVQPDDNTSGRTITISFTEGTGKLIGLKNPGTRDSNWDIPLILDKLLAGAGSAVNAVEDLKKKKKEEEKRRQALAEEPSVIEAVKQNGPVEKKKKTKPSPEDMGAPLTTSLGSVLKEAVASEEHPKETQEKQEVSSAKVFPPRRILPDRFSENLSGFIDWLEENSFLPELVSRWEASRFPYPEKPEIMVVDSKVCTGVLREMFDFDGHSGKAVGAIFREFIRRHNLLDLYVKGKDRSFYVLNEEEVRKVKEEHRLDVSYDDPTNIETLPSIGSVIEYMMTLLDVFSEGPMFVTTVKMIRAFRQNCQAKISDLQIANQVLGALATEKKSDPPKAHEGVLETRDGKGVVYWSISNKGLSLMKDFGLFTDDDVRVFVQRKHSFVSDFFGRSRDVETTEDAQQKRPLPEDVTDVDFREIEGKPLEILKSAGKEIRILLEELEQEILSGAARLAEMREALSGESRRQAIESAMGSIEEFPEDIRQEFKLFAEKLLAETVRDEDSQEEMERQERYLNSLDEDKDILSEVSNLLE